MPGLFNKSIIIVISNGQGPLSGFQKMTEVSCVSCEILRDEKSLFVYTDLYQVEVWKNIWFSI